MDEACRVRAHTHVCAVRIVTKVGSPFQEYLRRHPALYASSDEDDEVQPLSCLLGEYFQLVPVMIVSLTFHRHAKHVPSLAANARAHGIAWEGRGIPGAVHAHSSTQT